MNNNITMPYVNFNAVARVQELPVQNVIVGQPTVIPCFDFDTEHVNASVQQEWSNWKRNLDINWDRITYHGDNIIPESLMAQYKLQFLTSNLSPRVKKLVENCSNYRSASATITREILLRLSPAIPKFLVPIYKPLSKISKEIAPINLPKLIKELYEDIELSDMNLTNNIFDKINQIKGNQIKTVIEARNNYHKTLVQVAIYNRSVELAGKLLEFEAAYYINKQEEPKNQGTQPYNLVRAIAAAAEAFVQDSTPMLVDYKGVRSHNRVSIAISIILGVYNFKKLYQETFSCKNNKEIGIVDALLRALEFDERCADFLNIDEGRGLLYYEVAARSHQNDVELFATLLECYAIVPLKRFLENSKMSTLLKKEDISYPRYSLYPTLMFIILCFGYNIICYIFNL